MAPLVFANVAPLGRLVSVAPGTTVSPLRAPINAFAAAASGAQVTIETPASPQDGDVLLVVLIGIGTPVKLAPTGSASISDPQNPGSFTTSAVFISSASVIYIYQTTAARWVSL